MGGLLMAAGCGTRMFLHMKTVEVDERVKLYLGGGGNSAALLHGGEALLVDVKMGDFARRLRRSVEQDLGRKVQRMLITHAHSDHVGGIGLYPEVGVVMVHPRTRQRMVQEDRAGKLRWVPFVEVEDEIRLHLGGEEVVVRYLGVGHTDGDLVALLPAHRLLIAGDLLIDGYEPYGDTPYGGDILQYRYTMEELLKLEFDRALPGHGGVMERAQAERQRDFLAALEGEVKGQLERGASEEEAVKAVTLPQFAFEPLPLKANREINVRAMYRALKEAAKRSP